MTIPEPLQNLIERLNQELDETERLANRGLSLLQPWILQFTNNVLTIRYLAYFNNALFFVNISRRRVQTTRQALLLDEVTDAKIQQSGEELSEIFGRVLETKIEAQSIIKVLER